MVSLIYKIHVSDGVLDVAKDIAIAVSSDEFGHRNVFIDLNTAGDNFPADDNVYTNELREALDEANEADCEYLHLY